MYVYVQCVYAVYVLYVLYADGAVGDPCFSMFSLSILIKYWLTLSFVPVSLHCVCRPFSLSFHLVLPIFLYIVVVLLFLFHVHGRLTSFSFANPYCLSPCSFSHFLFLNSLYGALCLLSYSIHCRSLLICALLLVGRTSG